jgi:choline dehydrogenase-like flavoprotein
MTHVAFQPRGPAHAAKLELDADYVVVGSGAGGATAAVTLARGGASVALVEAGPWRDPEDYPSSMYGTMRDMFDDFGATVAQGRAFWPVVQGALVGGSTVINSAIAVPTPADVFDRWASEFGITRSLRDAVWKIQDELSSELNAVEVPPRARGKHNDYAMEASQKLGIEGHYMHRYVRDCEGNGQCLQGCKRNKKQSMNVTFVPELRERGGTVMSCAPVDKVVFEKDRAVAVTGTFRKPVTYERGADFVVRAKRGVLVAASVTHSPLLLKRSGLKSRALGENFRSHPGAPIIGVYDEPIDMNVGATQGWASLAYREKPGFKLETLSLPLDMLSGRLAGGGELLMQRLSEYRHFACWVQACRAESVGRVAVGPFGKPIVKYTLDRADMERFREGLALVAKMHFAQGARAVLPGIFGVPYSLTRDQLPLLESAPLDPRAYVAVLSHLFGGCVMGSDPDRSVCDERGRVHGVKGLYIADASAIPSNLGVNPQHTIMALARHWSEQILAAA